MRRSASRDRRRELRAALSGRARRRGALRRAARALTSLRVGGPADALASPADRDAARAPRSRACARRTACRITCSAAASTRSCATAASRGVVLQLRAARRSRRARAARCAPRRASRTATLTRFCVRARPRRPRVRRGHPGHDRRLDRDERGRPGARGEGRRARDRGGEARRRGALASAARARCASRYRALRGLAPDGVVVLGGCFASIRASSRRAVRAEVDRHAREARSARSRSGRPLVRLGIQEPAGRLRRPADRGGRAQGAPHGRRRDLARARELHREPRRRHAPPTCSR